MTRFPLVEVRCENCSHYATAHTLTSVVAPVCNVGNTKDLLKYPCKEFRFKSNTGFHAIIHRVRLANGLDRPGWLDMVIEGGEG